MKITDFKAGMAVYTINNEKVVIEVIYAAKNGKPTIFARDKTGFAKWYSPDELSEKSPIKWIDLGLPSGTLWKSYIELNEKGEPLYLTFEESKATFKSKLPKPWQFTELRDECKWEWKEDGYKITGPNGNSIFLPAAGYKKDNVIHDISCVGNYWSAIPFSKENIQYLSFSKGCVFPNCFLMCSELDRLTIILCKK